MDITFIFSTVIIALFTGIGFAIGTALVRDGFLKNIKKLVTSKSN